jgi:hypothetical protein
MRVLFISSIAVSHQSTDPLAPSGPLECWVIGAGTFAAVVWCVCYCSGPSECIIRVLSQPSGWLHQDLLNAGSLGPISQRLHAKRQSPGWEATPICTEGRGPGFRIAAVHQGAVLGVGMAALEMGSEGGDQGLDQQLHAKRQATPSKEGRLGRYVVERGLGSHGQGLEQQLHAKRRSQDGQVDLQAWTEGLRSMSRGVEEHGQGREQQSPQWEVGPPA